MTYTFNNKAEVIKMINDKCIEVIDLTNEGHMPNKEGQKLLRNWKRLIAKIKNNQYDITKLPKEHPDLFISQTMLYHPDNYDVVNNLIEMLGIK